VLHDGLHHLLGPGDEIRLAEFGIGLTDLVELKAGVNASMTSSD
jgi:hypothetical protein